MASATAFSISVVQLQLPGFVESIIIPLAPTIPVGPVAPVIPVPPVGPIGAIFPVLPVEPVFPVEPVLPVGPVTQPFTSKFIFEYTNTHIPLSPSVQV